MWRECKLFRNCQISHTTRVLFDWVNCALVRKAKNKNTKEQKTARVHSTRIYRIRNIGTFGLTATANEDEWDNRFHPHAILLSASNFWQNTENIWSYRFSQGLFSQLKNHRVFFFRLWRLFLCRLRHRHLIVLDPSKRDKHVWENIPYTWYHEIFIVSFRSYSPLCTFYTESNVNDKWSK